MYVYSTLNGVITVPTLKSFTKMREQTVHDARPHARSPTSFLCMDAWRTSQLNVAYIRMLRGSLMCLAYLFGISFIDVCTTRHWQTSGRLVQELNACTIFCWYLSILVIYFCLSDQDFFRKIPKEMLTQITHRLQFKSLHLLLHIWSKYR